MLRFALALVVLPVAARANSALWFDPDLGCGRAEVYQRTGQLSDLPGCSGALPERPPEVEQALHDAKRGLLDVDALLARGSIDGADKLLDTVERRLARTPPPNPELRDRWGRARPLYERALDRMRARRRLLPRLGRLAAAWRAAVDGAATMTARE